MVIRSRPRQRGVERAGGEPDRLFEAARRFDSSALGSLFDRSFGTVYPLLVALLGDAELAEAAATATYARVLEWLGDAHGRRTGLNGWVARTACLEAARRRPAVDQSANSAGGSPRDARHLRAVLWTLPSDQREIVALRVLTDMDIAEMAAAGGRSVRLTLDLLQLGLRHLAGDSRRFFGRGSGTALDQALGRISAGATPDAAASAAQVSHDQLPLLEAAGGLRTLLPESVDAEAMARVRAAVVAAASEHRAQWVHAHQGIPPLAPPARRPLRTAGRLATTTLLVVFAVLGGLAVAGFAVTSEPDSAVYPLRRIAEDVLVTVHRDPASRAHLEVDLADQRLREANAMALSGRASLAVQATHDRYVELRQAARALIDSSARDAGWRQARAKLVADETVGLQQLEEQLTAAGDAWAAQQVRDEVASFQGERKFLDQELGATPAPPAPSNQGGQATPVP